MKRQLSGGFVSPEWIKNPSLAEPYIDQAAAAGYSTWVCLVRYLKARSIFDEDVKIAIGKLAEIVHSRGLKFYLDTEPGIWASVVVNEDPEAALWVAMPLDIEVFEGRFHVFLPALSSHDPIAIADVPAVYGFDSEGAPFSLLPALSYQWQHGTVGKRGFYIEGSLSNRYTGRIRLYVAVSNSAEIDYSSHTLLRLQRELLEFYRDIPLDGIGWDEPGKGHSSLTSFRVGKDFFELFKRNNDYDLKDKLIYLDCFDDTAEAVKVRCDYYRTLSDMNFQVQDEHNKQAKAIWGPNLLLGTHQTWSGLPADLAGGVFDHFRLGALLSEAWADGGYDLELKTSIFPFMLADSLKKGLEKPNAYFNDWIMRDDYGTYRSRNRLKTLFNINAFTIVYSDFSELMVNTRLEPLRSLVDNDVRLLDDLNELIGPAKGESNVAVWYGWEGYAALPKKYARAVYTFFQNTSLFLVDSSIFTDFVSSEMLTHAYVIEGVLHTSGGRYNALVLPYAYVLPTGLWELIVKWASSGLDVIFVGPEPQYTSDGGKINFAETVGFRSYGIKSFDSEIAKSGCVLDPDAWEPAFLDVSPQVKIVEGESPKFTRSASGKVIAGRSNRLSISWVPSLDPREDIVELLKNYRGASLRVYSSSCIYRAFKTNEFSEETVLVLAPRTGVPGWGLMPSSGEVPGAPRPEVKLTPFDGMIRIDGSLFEFSGCEWAAIHFRAGKVIAQMVEGPDFSIREIAGL